jgi:predicted Rossmann-fold nucleotide-binding protein
VAIYPAVKLNENGLKAHRSTQARHNADAGAISETDKKCISCAKEIESVAKVCCYFGKAQPE